MVKSDVKIRFDLRMDNVIIHILTILRSAAGGEERAWCITDQGAAILYVSEGFVEQVNTPRNQISSIFQFNPEWSYMRWQEIYAMLSTDQMSSMPGMYLSAGGKPEPCDLRLTLFGEDTSRYVLYEILSDYLTNDGLEVVPLGDVADEGSLAEVDLAKVRSETIAFPSQYNYDDSAPNPVLYFGDDGQIQYSNAAMKKYNDHATDTRSVTDLFLESEIGPMVEGLQAFRDQDKEVIVRMIMKSKKGMVDGFSRCSFHGDPAPGIIRLEFLVSEGMQLIDQPLESAMAELDRLRGDVEDAKAVLLENQLSDFSFENIITRSPRYKSVLRQVAQVADTNTTVLITGETGTGKELLCNALYSLSDRADQLIVKVNCASIPETLIESILFGHEKGAFTGADARKIGKFELANGGTIFLDEIGELPLELQAKMLRVLQEGEIERIGNPTAIKIDVRIIAATNRNLEAMSKQGRFRSDLFYRLNVFPIHNIPLRDRQEDVPLLIQHFIEKLNNKTGRNVRKIRSKDLTMLSKYNWPGNVRELENLIERSIILSDDDFLNLDFFGKAGPNSGDTSQNAFSTYDDMVKIHIQNALDLTSGKVTGIDSASEILGLNGKTLASKLRKYNIDPKAYRS